MARAQTRGHSIFYDMESKVWRYADTCKPTPPYGGEERPCTACGKTAEHNGPDPCLTGLPTEVHSACCGHGVEKGYVIWTP